MRVHNKGIMFTKTGVYCPFLPSLTFCAGKQNLNNSCPEHLRVHREIFSSICWFNLIQISMVAAVSSRLSIMVGPVWIVGPVFDWIMIRWAVTRAMDGQSNISLSGHTRHYLSMLCACWWTGTSPPSKHGGEARHGQHRARSVSLCSLWCNLTIRSGLQVHPWG